jgi:hypothetical protein
MRAIRLAMICTFGNGLMAAAHVDSILGSYLLWAVAAAPRAMMTPTEATRLIITQGLMLALAVPLSGILVEAPWMYVPPSRSLFRCTSTSSSSTTSRTPGL